MHLANAHAGQYTVGRNVKSNHPILVSDDHGRDMGYKEMLDHPLRILTCQQLYAEMLVHQIC